MIRTHTTGRSATGLMLATAAAVLAALLPPLATAGAAHASRGAPLNPSSRQPPAVSGCTMAIPSPHATIEAQIANAAGFCELVSPALADEVFRSAVMVMPGRLWHYADAALSCRLRYRQTAGRMTIRNSAAACRWFTRTATGWRREAGWRQATAAVGQSPKQLSRRSMAIRGRRDSDLRRRGGSRSPGLRRQKTPAPDRLASTRQSGDSTSSPR
jgi:hypothetical protein